MTLKYLLVLFVVGIGIWMVSKRLRGSRRDPVRRQPPAAHLAPQAMLRCAHCGLHLPAADALGTRASDDSLGYCSEAHRRLGPGPSSGR